MNTRLLEIGLVGRMSHNLAKYRTQQSSAYTPEGFKASVYVYMLSRGVDVLTIERYISETEQQSEAEVIAFATQGSFLESFGGSSVWVGALIGPILDELGYSPTPIRQGILQLKRLILLAMEQERFIRADQLILLLHAYDEQIGLDEQQDKEDLIALESLVSSRLLTH